MVTLVYLAAYLGTVACVAIVALNVINYLKKPQHVRWELYPVGHETTERLAYGGSFREDVDWWKQQRQTSLCNSIKVMATEVLFLHATFEHNKTLWIRTYPFHLGLYVLFGGFFLTIFAALAQLVGVEPGAFLTTVGNLVQVCSLVGFIGVTGGAAALLYRRLKQEALKVQAVGDALMGYIAGVRATLAGFFEIAFPDRGGKLYTPHGVPVSHDMRSMVLNRCF